MISQEIGLTSQKVWASCPDPKFSYFYSHPWGFGANIKGVSNIFIS
jgi:hypothetical protein